MKHFYKIFFLLAMAGCLTACGDSDPKPEPTPPTPVTPEVTVSGLSAFTLSETQGNQTLTFTSNVSWSITTSEILPAASSFAPAESTAAVSHTPAAVARMETRRDPLPGYPACFSAAPAPISIIARIDHLPLQAAALSTANPATRAASWFSVSPSSGAAGSVSVTVTTLANEGVDDREGSITIQAGTIQKVIPILQKKKGAIILSAAKKSIPKEGGTFDIELKTNLDYEIIIPDAYKGWISQVQTKALTTYNLRFQVEASSAASTRKGEVIFKDRNSTLADTIMVSQAGQAVGLEKDRAALIALYNATNGANWKNNTNWCSDRPLNEWYGLWFSWEGQGRVTGLLLNDNNLSGSIPPEIGDLDALTQIFFYRNANLGGTLPKELYTLQNLRELLLSTCAFRGTISPQIGNLSNLKQLWLGNNLFTGEIPAEIGALSQLEELLMDNADRYYGSSDVLNWNTFSGELPAELGHLKNLWSLSLFNNRLSGPIPESIGKMTSLRSIALQRNQLEGPIPASIGNLSELQALQLYNNKLSGSIPPEIGNLTHLTSLDLSSNVLSGTIPTAICNMSNLGILQLGDNALSGSIPPEIGNLRGLARLDLYNNQFTGSIPVELCDLRYLSWIRLNNFEENITGTGWNRLSGPLPAEIGRLGRLWVLMVSNNNLTGNMPESIKDLSGLTFFWLYGNRLSGTIPTSITTSRFWSSWEPEIRILPQQSGYTLTVLNNMPETPSTDYSRDGEVTALQQATRGRGVNLVFMGDGYKDTDIASGKYDNVMRTAMEHFFAEEPAKSLRNYFNVYSVKIVSPYSDIAGGQGALGTQYGNGTLVEGNDEKCFQYARGVTGINLTQSVVIVVMNSKIYAGTCYMYYDQAAIAYFPLGVNDEMFGQLIRHEAVGHGFAKLGDEYGYPGRITDEAIEEYRYHVSLGWLGNVDLTNDPATVKWASFLSDARYTGQIGIYEGALTYNLGAYRPTDNSIMRHNTGGFNAPSRQAIYKRVMEISGEGYSYENFITYDAINRTRSAAMTRAAQATRVDPATFVPLHPPVVVKGPHK